jgi:hypothetical protein
MKRQGWPGENVTRTLSLAEYCIIYKTIEEFTPKKRIGRKI